MSSFKPAFEVTTVESMQWNRTLNIDMLSALNADPGREDEERKARESGQLSLPDDALERIRRVIADEVSAFTGKEEASDAPATRVDVKLNYRASE